MSFLSTKTVFIRKAIQNDVRVCVLFATKFLIFRGRESEMKMILITHARAFERKRDSSSLSPLQKHIEYATRAVVTKRESTKKTFATYLFISVV